MRTLTRRDFLYTSAALGAGATLRSSSNAHAQNPRPITFGFSLYGMRSLSVEAAVRTCAQIGYNAIELAAMPGWPGDPQRFNRDARRQLRNQLRRASLALPAIMENTPLTVDRATHRRQLDRLQRAAEMGRELSPNAQPVIETILGGRSNQWLQVRNQFAQRLADWARIAERARTVIAVKPHRGGAMNTPAHALWLMQRVNSPWIKLAYDYSHFQHRNMTLRQTLRDMLPHTRFVHIKDVRVQEGRTQFLLPGAGTIDFAEMLRQLRRGNYRGCVCVEVSGQIHGRRGYDAAATARQCYQNMAPVFRRAGIRL